jgi:glycine betaine/proline transport system ATP-binding protein
MSASAMSEQKIDIRGLCKVFGGAAKTVMHLVREGIGKQELLDDHNCVLALRDINLRIPAERIQVVMGLSGSGKSTLIRHINRLIEPTAGDIIVDGQSVPGMDASALRDFRRNTASMVFQGFALMPHRTVRENIGYGLKIRGLARDEIDTRVSRWIERIGLDGFADRFPTELSGGMQQRVGLGRALATDPDILLMDEAFSALDPVIRVEMQDILLALQTELKKTIMFITHDLDEALRIGDDIAILRDGEIVQQGAPQDIVLAPSDDYIAEFVKDINRGRVIQVGRVMGPVSDGATGPEIPHDSLLEAAAIALAEATADTGTVTDADGRPVGTISRGDLMAAMVMATPESAPAKV